MPRRQKHSIALASRAALLLAGALSGASCFRDISLREAGVDASDEAAAMPDGEAGAADVEVATDAPLDAPPDAPPDVPAGPDAVDAPPVDTAPPSVYRIVTQPRMTLDQCVGNCLLPMSPRAVNCPGDRRMSLPNIGSALSTAIVWSAGSGMNSEFSGFEWLYCLYLNQDGTLDTMVVPQRVSLAAMGTIAGAQFSPSPICAGDSFVVGFRWAEYGVDTAMQRIVSIGFNCARAADWATSETAFTTTPIIGQPASAGAMMQDTNCPRGTVPTHFRVWQDDRLRGIQLECSRFVP